MAETEMYKFKSKKQLKEEAQRARADEKQREIDFKERVISEVAKQKCIWDMRSLLHRDRCCVDAAWDEISAVIGKPKESIKKTWKVLKDHFRTVFMDIVRQHRNSNGLVNFQDKLDAVKWPFFHSLLFLKEVCTMKETASNVPDPIVESYTHSPESQQVQDTEEDDEVLNVSDRDVVCYNGNKEDDVSYLPPRETSSPNSVASQKMSVRGRSAHQGSSYLRGTKRRYEPNASKWHDSLCMVGRELNMLPPLPMPDPVTRFCDHLGDILRDIPQEKRRVCFQSLLQVANFYADGIKPVILAENSVHSDIILGQ